MMLQLDLSQDNCLMIKLKFGSGLHCSFNILLYRCVELCSLVEFVNFVELESHFNKLITV